MTPPPPDTDGAILRLCEFADNQDRWGLVDAARAEHDDLRARLAASEARVKELERTTLDLRDAISPSSTSAEHSMQMAKDLRLRGAVQFADDLADERARAWRERAEAAEKRVAELEDALEEVIQREDAKLKEAHANGMREREEQAEVALPDAVRSFRESKRSP